MELRTRVVTAMRWSAAARFLGQLFSWVVTIWVIRLLDPADYGLMAMCMVLVALLIGLNTLGLDAVLVQEKQVSDGLRRQIFGVVIVTNLVFFAALILGAPVIAQVYREPALEPLLRVLALVFPLLIFETLPQSGLERELDFFHRSVVEFVAMILGSLTTLALALLDYGVWALAWGMLAQTVCRVAGLNLVARNLCRPNFSLAGMGRHLRFGGYVSVDRGLWGVFSESDKFIGGRLLGNQALGYYSVASQVASLPIQKVTGILNSVAFPAFSRAHADTSSAKVQEYLLTATRVLAIAAFPVFLGIGCTAHSIIAVLLGDKWLPAAPLLQVLAVVMPFRLLGNVFSPLLWGVGRPGTSASNYLLAAIAMPVAFYIGVRWGLMGLVLAWLSMYPLVFLVTAYRTCQCVGLRLPDYLRQLWRPFCASLVMYVAVLTTADLIPGQASDWWHLLAQILLGILTYGLVILLIDRDSLLETLALLKA